MGMDMVQLQQNGEGEKSDNNNTRKKQKVTAAEKAPTTTTTTTTGMVEANSKKSIYMFFIHDAGCPNSHSLYAVDIPDPLLPPPESESDPSIQLVLEEQTLSSPLVEFPHTKYPYGMCAVEFDSKLYFLGGLFDHGEDEARYSRDVYVFDPTTYLLEVAPELNSGKFSPLAFTADSKIYALSGSVLWTYTDVKKLSRFEVFENGKWTPLEVDPPFHNTTFNRHAIVNRKVFISTATEGLFCFDLDSFGWTKIISDGHNSFSPHPLGRNLFIEENFHQGIFGNVVPPFEGSAEFVEDTLYACSDALFGPCPCSFGPSSFCNNSQEEKLFHSLAFLSPGVVEAPACLADPSSSLTHMGQRRFCHLIVGNPPHPLDPEATDPSKFYVDLTMFEASKETYYSERKVFSAMVYHLWRERNNRVFQHRGRPVEAIILAIEGDTRAGLTGWKKLPCYKENTRLDATWNMPSTWVSHSLEQ